MNTTLPRSSHHNDDLDSVRMRSYSQAIHEALAQEMARDASVFVMGQGVDDFKGFYGTTLGLADQFGADRRTIARWQLFWRDLFPNTPSWKVARARLAPDARIARAGRCALLSRRRVRITTTVARTRGRVKRNAIDSRAAFARHVPCRQAHTDCKKVSNG